MVNFFLLIMIMIDAVPLILPLCSYAELNYWHFGFELFIFFLT